MLGIFGYLGAKDQRKAINAQSAASHPARLKLSGAKLRRLCPSLCFTSGLAGALNCFFWDGWEQQYVLRDVLIHGDSRAAVVVALEPLRVACYCDDMDGVCLVRFADDIVREHEQAHGELRVGSRMLTVLNSWSSPSPATPSTLARDIVQGPNADPHYVNFWPLVAEFLTDEMFEVEARKAEIDEAEFAHCRALGEEHLRRHGGAARDGRPTHCGRPVGQPRLTVDW